MTLYEFIQADEMEQIEAFWNGVYIGERSDGEFKIECRQINEFYVECKILGGHYIDMRPFKNPQLLEPYLNTFPALDINDLLKNK